MNAMRSCLLLLFAATLSAQQFDFPDHSTAALPALARQVLQTYDGDSRFHLQIVAGDYSSALASLDQLRARRDPALAAWMDRQYEIDARAKEKPLPFDEAYRAAFREVVEPMPGVPAALLVRAMDADPQVFSFDRFLATDLDRQKGKTTITLADAVALLRDFDIAQTYRDAAPLVKALIAEDDARRYVIDRDVAVKTKDGATLCTLVVRPRNVQRTPALLEFTIYVPSNIDWVRLSASYGYAAVQSLARGKGCSPDRPMPYEHDASDAATVIDWIAAQPWSDGRVGMYGGSYSGFTAFAAAKRMPKALKAIAVGAAAAPGIDVPMEGNVVWNFVYPWPFFTTDNKTNDDAVYNDSARWTRLNQQWYASGRAYRDLDKIDGTPNPIFDKWIAHPDYDAYWQSMIPYRDEFARIDIPVLQTAGYYYGGPGAAVYYMTQHQKYNRRAQHYLLIGPYDHFGAQHGVVNLLGRSFAMISGYTIDPVAMLDLEALRYAFFDWVLKNALRPELLADKVNYEVTGANVWKHAPAIDAMSSRKMRLYLSGDRLTSQPLTASTALKVDLSDRSDVKRESVGGAVLDKVVDTWNGLKFVSDPLPFATELSGLFSGALAFTTNKKDFDFEIDLYELTRDGAYIQLAPFWTRASNASDLTHRRLLAPGKRLHLPFKAVRLMSRQLAAGSRVVAVLTVIKAPDRQINYGTGKDVNDATIQDAGAPLEIRWFGDSYIDLPLGN